VQTFLTPQFCTLQTETLCSNRLLVHLTAIKHTSSITFLFMHLSLPPSESIHIAYHILSLIIFTNIQVLSYITELKSLYVPRLAMYYVGSLCSTVVFGKSIKTRIRLLDQCIVAFVISDCKQLQMDEVLGTNQRADGNWSSLFFSSIFHRCVFSICA